MSTALPEFWRYAKEIHGLVGLKCKRCGKIMFPRRKICPKCGNFDENNFEEVEISKKGTIHSYVVCYYTPRAVRAPVPLAVVDTDNGARLLGFVTECNKPGELSVGLPVEAVFRRIGVQDGRVNYGYKFRPIK